MSRNTFIGPPSSRSLSLTEELEKLEQSITLTLQEIDSNFNRAHRIVTTSILPLVEQYGEHSRAVWDASKFWKQFFEASANVSLSGYEELANNDEENTMTATAEDSTALRDDTTGADVTPRPRSHSNDTTATVTGQHEDESSDFQHHHHHRHDESVLSDDGGTLTGSTPRPPATKSMSMRPQFAGLGSPYEVLKREMKKEEQAGGGASSPMRGVGGEEDEDDTELLFQQHTARLPDMSMTPRSSIPGGASSSSHPNQRDEESAFLFSGQRPKPQDPIMHRALDKNYRLMATPLKAASSGVSPIRWRITEKKKDDTAQLNKGKEPEATKPIWADSPTSSPEMEMPKLRSEAFMSPLKPSTYRHKLAAQAALAAPRTPGVSVQTPAGAGRKTRDVYARGTPRAAAEEEKETDEITWESSGEDDDFYGGMSPPKTIQFALPPSKLLQTPAREASKRIVEDILLTAGAEPDEDGEYSPTMVKMNPDLLDDTF
ncbi:DASH complex subunit Ask1-domain-containing protein [Coniochaeta sp. 2T2.1]|nr:DASH complex subunit Ask1-domain-containing protein [Coniochaeta sp. 2T2.1]